MCAPNVRNEMLRKFFPTSGSDLVPHITASMGSPSRSEENEQTCRRTHSFSLTLSVIGNPLVCFQGNAMFLSTVWVGQPGRAETMGKRWSRTYSPPPIPKSRHNRRLSIVRRGHLLFSQLSTTTREKSHQSSTWPPKTAGRNPATPGS